jgi:ubiquinone/menaquinone biosynthesis C-methylase UbiE
MAPHLYGVLDRLPSTYWRYVARHRLFLRLWERYRAPRPRYRVLDVGCGPGGFLEYLSARTAIDPVGVDLYPEALAYGRRRGLRALCVADAARLPFRDERFDLVVAQDVVEHVADDVALLEGLARVCEPGGLALVVAPAGTALWSTRDVRLGHHRRYTLDELTARVGDAGFRLLHRTYLDLWLLPVLRAAVAVARRTPDGIPDLPHEAPGGVGVLNAVLRGVSRAEAALTLRVSLPLGVSALVLGARPARRA